MNSVALAGLMKIEFPARTVRLCDGGRVVWGAESFAGRDDVFGTIGALEPLSEGAGDEVPALLLKLLPPEATAVADLSQPGFQTVRVRLWITEFDLAAGTVIGTPALQFDGQIDQTSLTVGRASRDLGITVVSTAERLFTKFEGNSLSPTFHIALWPGETGMNEATALTVTDAWGVEAPVIGGGSANMFYNGDYGRRL